MASTTTSGRTIILPDLSGWWGADALDELDGLGLASAPCFLDVEDVAEAGYVIGQDPPPNQPCRKKQIIQINIGKHPDHDPAELIERITQQPGSVQPSLTAPLTFPSGRTDAQAPAGTPWTGPAESPAAPSSILPRPIPAAPVPPVAPGAPTPPTRHTSPTPQEPQGAVPTPDQYAAKTSQPRASAEAPGSAGVPVTPPRAEDPGEDGMQEIYDFSSLTASAPVRAEYVRPAGRKARKRRRFQRMPLKQKLIAGGLVAVFIALFVLTMSSHPAKESAAAIAANTHPYARTNAVSPRHRASRRRTHAPGQHRHKAAKVKTVVRVRTIVKRGPTRTRIVTLTVTTPTSSSPTQPTSSTPPASSSTPPASSSTPSTADTSSSTSASRPAVQNSTAKPSSTPPSSTSRPSTTNSAKGGGGSALQNPDGSALPPTPTQP